MALTTGFLDLCKKLISIESTPTTGNGEVANYCASLCKAAGLEVTLQEISLKGLSQFNVLARPPQTKTAQEEIIFQTHLDTVEPGPLANWTKTDSNPFKATIDNDKIYGLGTADVKLDFLCKLEALKNFKDKTFKRPFVLVGSCAEEIGMHGAHHLMESHATKAKMAIIGEPSELKIVYANNGYMVMDFQIPFSPEEKQYLLSPHDTSRTQEKVFHGKAVHSSTPHLGENAILKLVSYIEKMPQGIAVLKAFGGSTVNTVPADASIEVDATKTFTESVGKKLLSLVKELQKLEREFLAFDNKSFNPPCPTLNVGTLDTTDEGLKISVSFRLTPDIEVKKAHEWVERIESHGKKNKYIAKASRISPPGMTSLSSELVSGALEIARNLSLPDQPITKAGGTESSIYTPFGIDCIVFGPGVSIGNSHTANEYNILSQLEKAQDFYAEAVKRFCI